MGFILVVFGSWYFQVFETALSEKDKEYEIKNISEYVGDGKYISIRSRLESAKKNLRYEAKAKYSYGIKHSTAKFGQVELWVIDSVSKDSATGRMALRAGDFIETVNGRPVYVPRGDSETDLLSWHGVTDKSTPVLLGMIKVLAGEHGIQVFHYGVMVVPDMVKPSVEVEMEKVIAVMDAEAPGEIAKVRTAAKKYAEAVKKARTGEDLWRAQEKTFIPAAKEWRSWLEKNQARGYALRDKK